tara:strand:- start:154 stop:555 length:402 start_codon:yes stop_codon:yes gene_type:complete
VPVQRRSQGFLDLSASFQNNPMSNDLISLKNETAIARSVRNLILTTQGERPFQPVLGSNVNNLLFDNMDKLTAASLKTEIETTIENYEPRVDINDIIVDPNYDNNEFNVTVSYYIVGMDVPEQELSFVLESTR